MEGEHIYPVTRHTGQDKPSHGFQMVSFTVQKKKRLSTAMARFLFSKPQNSFNQLKTNQDFTR